MVRQPPNSPQFNALDATGVFDSLQNNVFKERARSIDKLMTQLLSSRTIICRVFIGSMFHGGLLED